MQITIKDLKAVFASANLTVVEQSVQAYVEGADGKRCYFPGLRRPEGQEPTVDFRCHLYGATDEHLEALGEMSSSMKNPPSGGTYIRRHFVGLPDAAGFKALTGFLKSPGFWSKPGSGRKGGKAVATLDLDTILNGLK